MVNFKSLLLTLSIISGHDVHVC